MTGESFQCLTKQEGIVIPHPIGPVDKRRQQDAQCRGGTWQQARRKQWTKPQSWQEDEYGACIDAQGPGGSESRNQTRTVLTQASIFEKPKAANRGAQAE